MSDLVIYKTTRPAPPPAEDAPSFVTRADYKGVSWYDNFLRWATEESTEPVPENPGYWNHSPMSTLSYGATGAVFDGALNRTENRELQRHQLEPYQVEPHQPEHDPALTQLVSALLVTGAISRHPLTPTLPLSLN